ncbi:hypothetical protein CEXT_352521 [Caerostris extrusa]|uniref:Uncharacterized protein n=1 Tax=Caerostris extrusa TaxID=172846 RepID=A0AAV4NW59_CAEEX|nr:hypothetical protein CEXT_352521 [Caerostris extrusa]
MFDQGTAGSEPTDRAGHWSNIPTQRETMPPSPTPVPDVAIRKKVSCYLGTGTAFRREVFAVGGEKGNSIFFFCSS